MRGKRLFIGWRATLAIFAVTLVVTTLCAASEKILHNFNNNGVDGCNPQANLIFDPSGNLYGTTFSGGVHAAGTVFELTPRTGGGWREKVLHNFNGTDGYQPGAGLIFDASGSLYGTTSRGGSLNFGTVFELTPRTGGGWRERVLHNFNGTDGDNLYTSLIFDAFGSLYGTASGGGAYDSGIVFELTPRAGGGWREKVLHNFNNDGGDVGNPAAGLIFDASGSLYGTTSFFGAVFELTPRTGGGWREKVLHHFSQGSTDGYQPMAGLIFNASGNLYGTTFLGGPLGSGMVFELTPRVGGGWKEKVLHSFYEVDGKDGHQPAAGLIFDASGDLYGTTALGGTSNLGTAFELTPNASGDWTERVLHSFNNDGKDGHYPAASLIFDASGNLYGTTTAGGAYGCGTVFEITP